MCISTLYPQLANPSSQHGERVYYCISDSYRSFGYRLTPSNTLLNRSLASGGTDFVLSIFSKYRT